jgi:hypothetical protein
MINPLYDYNYTKGNVYIYYWERYTEDYVNQYWRKYRKDILACGYYLSSKALYNSCVLYSLTSNQEGYCKVTLNNYGGLLNPYAKQHSKLSRTLWVMLHTVETSNMIVDISKYTERYMYAPTKTELTRRGSTWIISPITDEYKKKLTLDFMQKMGYDCN